jgi:hypothetical protein
MGVQMVRGRPFPGMTGIAVCLAGYSIPDQLSNGLARVASSKRASIRYP